MEEKYLGIKTLSRFYLFLTFFYFLPLAVFSTRIVFLGKTLSVLDGFLVNAASLLFTFLLYLLIKHARLLGFWLALIFHSLFFLNSLFIVYDKGAIFTIEGFLPGNYPYRLFAVLAGVGVNLWVILYLIFHKRCFANKIA